MQSISQIYSFVMDIDLMEKVQRQVARLVVISEINARYIMKLKFF